MCILYTHTRRTEPNSDKAERDKMATIDNNNVLTYTSTADVVQLINSKTANAPAYVIAAAYIIQEADNAKIYESIGFNCSVLRAAGAKFCRSTAIELAEDVLVG